MSINQILPFATATGANVLTPTDYAALPAQQAGFATGVASSEQLNTVWRQASFVAAMIATFIVNQAGVDVLDDGDVAGLEAKLVTALNELSLSNERATELGIGADLAITNQLSGVDLNTVIDVGDKYYTDTCTNKPFSGAGLIKVWREADNVIYQFVQGAGNQGVAWRYYSYLLPDGGWLDWQIAATTGFVSSAISDVTHAAQGGGDRAVAAGGFNTTETVVFNPTLAELPANGFLQVTASLNGGPGSYNFRLKTEITGTGVSDQSMADGQAVSICHPMCVPVAAGATPTITISAWSDTVSQAGTVQFSYLYIPSA